MQDPLNHSAKIPKRGGSASATPADDPLVSVIIAARNAEKTIIECVRSVLSQQVEALEVVVCDDGSEDLTPELLRSLADPRLKLLRNEFCMGAGPSRDRAINESSGQWIALIDADDAWLPNRLLKLLEATQSNPYAIVFDDIYDCHDLPEGLRPFRRVHGLRAFPGVSGLTRIALADYIVRPRLLAHPVFSRELVDSAGAMHGSRRSGQDLDFRFALLAAGGQLYYLPEPLYLYRQTAGSLSSGPDREREYLEIFDENRSKYPWPEEVLAAFSKKRRAILRTINRRSLAKEIRYGRPGRAMRQALRHPRALADLVAHAARQLIQPTPRR